MAEATQRCAGRESRISTRQCHQDSTAVWRDHAALAGATSGLETAGSRHAAGQQGRRG